MSQVTKRALEASLKNLLLKKPLSKITISDITEDCGINRMTFYYHFKDIYDLVEWSCQEDASKALAGNKTYETWQQGFLQLFKAVQDNKPFIMNVYHSVSREQVFYAGMPALTENQYGAGKAYQICAGFEQGLYDELCGKLAEEAGVTSVVKEIPDGVEVTTREKNGIRYCTERSQRLTVKGLLLR